MALCSSQLDSAMPQIKREDSSEPEEEVSTATASPEGSSSQENKPNLQPNPLYGLSPGALPLSVDYRSPVSHFIPPAVEMYNANKNKPEIISTADASESPTPAKRKRGRPRVDKTSPEYLAQAAARKQAREMAAVLNNSGNSESGEKRKRGRPRIDKTSPEYLARKRARELEALEKKAKRQYKRRGTGDSAASSSTGDTTPRVKRKYTKRALSAGGNGPGRPRKDPNTPNSERVKGKRGRPRKQDLSGIMSPNSSTPVKNMQAKIRVRSNLMPMNSEPISLDSDDEPDLGSPSQASDSLSLDENLRALRHLHEKYANLDKDDAYNAQLLAANCKKNDRGRDSEDRSVIELDTRVEKLEDSSNSDSDSSSSASGSGSGSSSSSSDSSSSSSGSESDSDDEELNGAPTPIHDIAERSLGASLGSQPTSDSDSDPERARPAAVSPARSISESENESPDKSFQCHICRKWYSTSVTLKIHRRSHQRTSASSSRSRNRSSSRYDCDCCSMTFTRREKLYEHKAEAHRGQMTVRCEVCRKCFEDEAELAAHDRDHTADERAGRCSTCGAQFPSHSALAKHRLTHASLAIHSCPQCAKGFSHAHSLTRHLQNHARQLYKCVVCKASFARADQLAQHLNSHLANYKRLKP